MKKYPVMLDLIDRLVVVVGSGPVGLRKAAGLLEAGARVKIVCLGRPGSAPAGGRANASSSMEMVCNSEKMIWILEPYRSAHLEGACLVFAAADSAVNAQVVFDAKRLGIWVNSADEPEAGDFLVPSLVRRGDLHVAISTGGTAPAVAKRLRERLEEQFDEAWAVWLAIHREIRDFILESIPDAEARHRLFEQLADLDWLRRCRAEGREAVAQAMRQVVNEAGGG